MAIPRPVFVLLLACAGFTGAFGQIARIVDTIDGDPDTVLEWSEGQWDQGGIPVPGGLTHAGGVVTGPGDPSAADSALCQPAPNGWKWTVTIPGPYTLQYQFSGFPPDITVCGQVFGMESVPNMLASVDLIADWIVCSNADSGEVIWSGRWSTFRPQYYPGFFTYAGSRCGRVRVIPEGACCNLQTGECFILIEEECAQQPYLHLFLGPDTVCEPNACPQPPPTGACCLADGSCTVVTEEECFASGGLSWEPGSSCEPNPCPPPVPIEESTWGRVKAIYR